MKECPNCGQQNPDTVQVCVKCGNDLSPICETTPAQQAGEQPVPETNPAQQAYEQPIPESNPAQPMDNFPVLAAIDKVKLLSVFGIISGVLSAIFGIVMFNMLSDITIQAQRYGGDFYTGTSEQLEGIAKVLSLGFGFILIVLGLFMIFHFACKLADKNQSN